MKKVNNLHERFMNKNHNPHTDSALANINIIFILEVGQTV